MCHNLKHLLTIVNVQVVKLVEVLQRVNTVTESETVVSCLVNSRRNSWGQYLLARGTHRARQELFSFGVSTRWDRPVRVLHISCSWEVQLYTNSSIWPLCVAIFLLVMDISLWTNLRSGTLIWFYQCYYLDLILPNWNIWFYQCYNDCITAY